MSFQLVYTSAPSLLDSPGSGYGTVARTEDIPRRLAQKLENISLYKEPAESRITGTQYSYQILEYDGAAYHVLSAICSAGADYSGRACHLAHHIALTPEEVIAMRRNSARPTPAGIILALRRASFWIGRWEGEPRTLSGEPRLSASALPDASRQTTWKRLTGHKSNARAFFTPPYDRDCLCLVPEGTDSETILLLINESDWLAASRGWGKTFTTHATASDSFSFTRRIFTTQGTTVLISQAEKAGKAILDISGELVLPELEPAAPAEDLSSRQEPAPSHPPAPSPHAPSPEQLPPYRYCESSDADTYEMPPKRINWLRVSGLVLGVGILAAGGILIHQGTLGQQPGGLVWDQNDARHDLETSPAPIVATDNLKTLVGRLRALCRAPYDATSAQITLDQLAAQVRQLPFPDSPDASAFQACISALREAGNLSSDYAAELISLMQFARQFHLSEHQLGRFFMHQVTYARNPDEAWRQSLEAEYPRWAFIFSRFPEMTTWLHQDFGPYMDPLLRRFSTAPPSPTPHRWVQGVVRPNLPLPVWLRDACQPSDRSALASDHDPPADMEDALPSGDPPDLSATMSQRPYALVAGQQDTAPGGTTVRQMLQEATQHPICHGELIIAHQEGEHSSPRRLFLDGEHYSLKAEYHPAGDTETFTFTLLGADGETVADFDLSLRFEHGELSDMTFNGGRPQIVCIPLPTRDHLLHPTILVRPLEIPIELSWATIDPPPLPLNRFRLFAGPNRKQDIRFGLQILPGIAPEDAYQLPEVELKLQKGASVCIPSIGYVCHIAPICGVPMGESRYSIHFRTIPNLHKELDIVPKVSCSINFQEFLVRQLAQLSRRFPLKDGQSLPLADLFFAAQQFELGENSKYPPDQIAQLYIKATQGVETVSAYRFFEQHIGTQFLALHGDSRQVRQMFDSPQKAKFVQDRIQTLLYDTLLHRFENYFHEYRRSAPPARLTLRLQRIDVSIDTLLWQFELIATAPPGDTTKPEREP